MARIVLILVFGGALAGGVYYFTLPDCKKNGSGDNAAVSSNAAVVTSRT